MPLTDEQIERYSRQLILPEVGVGGQERLGLARVAVVGDGVAAERVIAHLAAAGVGHIAAAPALHAAADPAQPDLRIVSLAASVGASFDAVVVAAVDAAVAATMLDGWRGRAGAAFWIADGAAGAVPPCPLCAAAAFDTRAAMVELPAVRDALVGTVVATEVVKALLAIGATLRGRAFVYDVDTATITTRNITARPTCRCAATP